MLKISANKFADYENIRTFAIPYEKKALLSEKDMFFVNILES